MTTPPSQGLLVTVVLAALGAAGSAHAEAAATLATPVSTGAAPAVARAAAAPTEVAPPVPTVSLREALRHAEADPPSVLVAGAALDRSEAAESAAEARWFPSVTAGVSGGYSYDNRIFTPGTPRYRSQSATIQGNVQMDWAILSLERAGAIDAARAAVQAQRLGRKAAERAAMAIAAETYVRARAATELVEDARLTLERRTKQHEGILELTRTGLRQPVDAQRAEIEVINARHVLALREELERAAWASLAVAMGRPPSSPVRPEGPVGDALSVSLTPSAAEALALQNRPERQQGEAQVRAREGEERAARGARAPTAGVAAQGNASYNDLISGIGIDGTQWGATVGGYLRWNGIDPVVWSRANVAEAATVESRRQLDAASLAIASEAAQGAYQVQQASTEYARAVAVLEASAATRDAQEGRYKAGLASLLELLDAEGIEQRARLDRIQAHRDHQIAVVRLLSACGLLSRLAR